jgi:hypothetical protein
VGCEAFNRGEGAEGSDPIFIGFGERQRDSRLQVEERCLSR